MFDIIFGGNGFVGKNLSQRDLINDPEKIPRRWQCNLLDINSIDNWIQSRAREDRELRILNLAGTVAGVNFNIKNNTKMLYENSLMALNLGMALAKNSIKAYYVYVSSVCGYAPGASEERCFFLCEPSKSNYGYGLSKKLGVNILKCLDLDGFKVRGTALVPTNMYGPFDNFSAERSHVIPSLIKQMITKPSEIVIRGHPETERDFLFVGDLCRAIDEVENHDYHIDLLNISTGQTVKISELVETIASSVDYTGKITYDFTEDKNIRRVSNSLFRKFFPKFEFTSLKNGIAQTVRYYETIC